MHFIFYGLKAESILRLQKPIFTPEVKLGKIENCHVQFLIHFSLKKYEKNTCQTVFSALAGEKA